MPPHTNPVESKPVRTFKPLKITIALVLAIFIFFLGVGTGDGRITLGSSSVFRKSEQKGLPANLDYSSVEQVYDKLKSEYDGQLDQTKLLDGLKEGLAQATGDPYTEYMNPSEAKDFNDQLNGTFSGIGAELGKDKQGNLIVVSPIAGFPADKAGLKPQDIIETINGNTTAGLSIDDAVSAIRGAAGTKVTLKIVRSDSQELTFTITRAEITVPSVNTKTLDGNIGYIQITRFADDTADLAQKAADSFKAAGVKAMILDLRDDPGGLLDAAVSVSSLWLPSGKTVLTERRDNVVVQTYPADGSAPLAGIPTVVLINEGSASASEITSGALHDNGAATLIGVKSFGKGSVQQLDNLVNGGVLKVTIAHWYTPKGVNINKEGITPDKTVADPTADQATAGQDPQLDAAKAALTQ